MVLFIELYHYNLYIAAYFITLYPFIMNVIIYNTTVAIFVIKHNSKI